MPNETWRASACDMAMRHAGPFVRFGLVGVFSYTATVALTALCHEGLQLSESLSFAIALVLVFAANFLLCRHFVFKATQGSAVRQVRLYFLASVFFRSAEWLAFYLVQDVLELGLHYVLTITIIKGGILCGKFVYFRTWVFLRREEPPESPPTERPAT